MKKLHSVISLIGFLFLISGCRPEIGGGGSVHHPPEYIETGKPTKLELELSVWGEGNQDVTKRYKEVACHFRIVGKDGFIWMPMMVSENMKGEGKAIYECYLPAFSEKDSNSVEYYFDMYFDGIYNKDPNVTVVPIRDTLQEPNER